MASRPGWGRARVGTDQGGDGPSCFLSSQNFQGFGPGEFRARQSFFFTRNVLTFEFLLPAAISPINVCFCSNFGLRKEKEKRIFGYSVKVFSYPDWKLPTCSETG